ncbi:MAG: glycosyltransferase family 4 protein [Methylococcales bacterium]
MSRFPKLTETFILHEILALEKNNVAVEVFPLLREHQKTSHPEALRLTQSAHFLPFISLPIFAANWFFFSRNPKAYLYVLAEIIKGTFGSVNFFVGAIGIFPKSVRFAYEMQTLGITHIHAHFCTHPAVAALIAHRLTGIPFSFTAHGSDLHVERRMLAEKVNAAAFVVTVSDFNKAVIVNECGKIVHEKVHVIHCGVDVTQLPTKSNWSLEGSLSILSVASFEEVKGHKFLVEACRILAHQGIQFRCHFVGEGPLFQAIVNQVSELGLKDMFHFHGGLARDEVIKLLADADVFVLASVPTKQGKREGIPVSLMEAMGSGVPVVASNLSGIPELVQHKVSGLLVSPQDSVSLANALENYYQSEELREEIGRSGKQQVVEQFDLEKNAIKLIELF